MKTRFWIARCLLCFWAGVATARADQLLDIRVKQAEEDVERAGEQAALMRANKETYLRNFNAQLEESRKEVQKGEDYIRKQESYFQSYKNDWQNDLNRALRDPRTDRARTIQNFNHELAENEKIQNGHLMRLTDQKNKFAQLALQTPNLTALDSQIALADRKLADAKRELSQARAEWNADRLKPPPVAAITTKPPISNSPPRTGLAAPIFAPPTSYGPDDIKITITQADVDEVKRKLKLNEGGDAGPADGLQALVGTGLSASKWETLKSAIDVADGVTETDRAKLAYDFIKGAAELVVTPAGVAGVEALAAGQEREQTKSLMLNSIPSKSPTRFLK